jgi:hypothetical protein
MAAMHDQPSAPSYQNYHARWQQSVLPPSDHHVPPLFDYELYRESRSRDPTFQIEPTNARSSGGGAIDQGCLGLSSLVNPYYESPHDQMGMNHHHYSNSKNVLQYGSPSVRSAVGPPVYLAGGGFELNPFQKAQQHVGQENKKPSRRPMTHFLCTE